MIEHRPFKELAGADHGWLKAKHHFSFGEHADATRMGWGSLRVRNDDDDYRPAEHALWSPSCAWHPCPTSVWRLSLAPETEHQLLRCRESTRAHQ